MKKIILVTLISITSISFSQEEKEKPTREYNNFSIEANVGQNKPSEAFSPGYYTADPTTYMNFNKINHFDLGFRYMLNEKFGLKLDGAYDIISPEKENESLPFEARQYRIGLQGVINLRKILNFDSFTKRLGLLAHAGVQISLLDPVNRNGVDLKDLKEDNGGFIFGVTPQFKLHRRVVLTGDVSFIQNTRQHLTWDGDSNPRENNLKATMINTSLGLTFYLGKHQEHADFYVATDCCDKLADGELGDLKKKLDDLQKKVDNMKMPELSMDQINRMIDDKMRPLKDLVASNPSDVELRRNIDEGFINVYFDFNRYTPHSNSIENINKVVNFMKSNPDKKLDLRGWADIIGGQNYNQKLSERRAETVKQILIKQGIDGSRLNVIANGQDPTAAANDEFGRAMVRRVTFTVID